MLDKTKEPLPFVPISCKNCKWFKEEVNLDGHKKTTYTCCHVTFKNNRLLSKEETRNKVQIFCSKEHNQVLRDQVPLIPLWCPLTCKTGAKKWL